MEMSWWGAGDVVGYNIRLESECSSRTKVIFMTPGVLLRHVQDDPTLSQWTHIIIGECVQSCMTVCVFRVWCHVILYEFCYVIISICWVWSVYII